MHARGREQRRDRRVLGVDAAVGQDEDSYGRRRRPGSPGGRARPWRARGRPRRRRREEHGDGGGLEARQVHVADPRQLLVVQDRGLELELSAGVGRRLEQVALGPDRRRDLRHELLADAVERRIGDLGEELLEVVVEQPRPVRQHGERRVGAHGAHGLLAVHRHGREEDAQVLVRVAEGELALEHRLVVGLRDRGRVGQALDRLEIRLQPLAVGMLRRVRVLELLVVDDAALRGVDEEHAAGLQALLEQDALGRDVEDADLGGHHDQAVLGDVVARGAQAVAVEHGADHGAVGERDGGGAVPGLHEAAVVLVERPPLLAPWTRARSTARGSSSSRRGAAGGRPSRATRARCRTWPSRCRPRPRSGRMRLRSSPRRRERQSASRACIQLMLPRSVLISPLWAM